MNSSIGKFKDTVQPSMSSDNSSEFTVLPNVNRVFLNSISPTLVPADNNFEGTFIDESIVDNKDSPEKAWIANSHTEESDVEFIPKKLIKESKVIELEEAEIYLEKENVSPPSNCYSPKKPTVKVEEIPSPLEEEQKKRRKKELSQELLIEKKNFRSEILEDKMEVINDKMETKNHNVEQKIDESEIHDEETEKVGDCCKKESVHVEKSSPVKKDNFEENMQSKNFSSPTRSCKNETLPVEKCSPAPKKLLDEFSNSEYDNISPDYESLDQTYVPRTPTSVDIRERIVSLWTNYISPNRDHSLFSNPSFSHSKGTNLQKRNLIGTLPNKTISQKPIEQELFSVSRKTFSESLTVRKSQSTRKHEDEISPKNEEKTTQTCSEKKSSQKTLCEKTFDEKPPEINEIFNSTETYDEKSSPIQEEQPAKVPDEKPSSIHDEKLLSQNRKEPGIHNHNKIKSQSSFSEDCVIPPTPPKKTIQSKFRTSLNRSKEKESDEEQETTNEPLMPEKLECEVNIESKIDSKKLNQKVEISKKQPPVDIDLKKEVREQDSDTDIAFNIDYCKIHDDDDEEAIKQAVKTSRCNDNKNDLICLGSSIGDTDLITQPGKKKHKQRRSNEDLINIGSSFGGTDFEATCPTKASKKQQKDDEIYFGSSNDFEEIREAEKKVENQIKKDNSRNDIQLKNISSPERLPSPKSSPPQKSFSPKLPSPMKSLVPSSSSSDSSSSSPPPPPPFFPKKKVKLPKKKKSLDGEKTTSKPQQSDCFVSKPPSQEIELSDESDYELKQSPKKKKSLDEEKKISKLSPSECFVSKPPSQEIESSDENDDSGRNQETSKERKRNKEQKTNLNCTLNKSKKKRRISSSDETDAEEPVDKTKEQLKKPLISYTPPDFQKDEESSEDEQDGLPQLPFKKKQEQGISYIYF